MSLFVSAGDASGDQHAARLVRALHAVRPGLDIAGFGGPELESAGLHQLQPLATNPVMGFRRVVGSLRHFMGVLSEADRWFEQHRPQLVVLVDYPGFNVNLAQLARRRGIRTLYYICPQYWGWAPWRLRRFARAVDEALVIFPFEEAFYGEAGIRATYVGHPVADRMIESPQTDVDSSGDRTRIALLAGSRRAEVEGVGPWLLDAAVRLRDQLGDTATFTTTQLRADLAQWLATEARRRSLPLEITHTPLPQLLHRCRVALVTSGTATLECALSGVPSLVVYRVGRAARLAARSLLLSPYIAQPNLLMGREVFPEFLVSDNPSQALAEHALRLWEEGRERRDVLDDLITLRRHHLKPGATSRARDHVIAQLDRS